MITRTLISVASVAALAACTPATETTDESIEASASADALAEVLASDMRAEDKARDEYRHPAETLAFFQVEPNHTVIEYAPGGGWYTRVLAPYVVQDGQFIGVSFAPEAAASLGEEFVERVRQFGDTFSAQQSEALEIPPEKLPF